LPMHSKGFTTWMVMHVPQNTKAPAPGTRTPAHPEFTRFWVADDKVTKNMIRIHNVKLRIVILAVVTVRSAARFTVYIYII
jgi:hypothetical protein